MQTKTLRRIKQDVETLLKKHNLRWTKLKVWEVSDGYLVEIESPDIEDDIKGIFLSRKLEQELKDPLVTLSILPSD
jgi:hypothetical protein